MSPLQVIHILANAVSGVDPPEATTILDIHLPRIIMANLVGIALSTFGTTVATSGLNNIAADAMAPYPVINTLPLSPH